MTPQTSTGFKFLTESSTDSRKNFTQNKEVDIYGTKDEKEVQRKIPIVQFRDVHNIKSKTSKSHSVIRLNQIRNRYENYSHYRKPLQSAVQENAIPGPENLAVPMRVAEDRALVLVASQTDMSGSQNESTEKPRLNMLEMLKNLHPDEPVSIPNRDNDAMHNFELRGSTLQLSVDLKQISTESKTSKTESKQILLESKQLPMETKQLPMETKQLPMETKRLPMETKQLPMETKQLPMETKQLPMETKQLPLVTASKQDSKQGNKQTSRSDSLKVPLRCRSASPASSVTWRLSQDEGQRSRSSVFLNSMFRNTLQRLSRNSPGAGHGMPKLKTTLAATKYDQNIENNSRTNDKSDTTTSVQTARPNMNKIRMPLTVPATSQIILHKDNVLSTPKESKSKGDHPELTRRNIKAWDNHVLREDNVSTHDRISLWINSVPREIIFKETKYDE